MLYIITTINLNCMEWLLLCAQICIDIISFKNLMYSRLRKLKTLRPSIEPTVVFLSFTEFQGDENFSVCHIHFTAWPDKDVPHDVTSMIEFRQKVRSLHKDMDCPLLVHCR